MIFSKLSEKNRVIVSIVLFVALFAVLLATATVFDLDVSKLLTENALADGEYLSHDVFGVAFEVFGSSPVFIIAGFAVAILFLYVVRFLKLRPAREIIGVVLFAGTVLAFRFFYHDMFKYITEHYVAAAAGSDVGYMEGVLEVIAVLCALLTSVCVVFALKGMKDETLKNLLKFVFAFILMAAVANLIIAVVKIPVGRMRFRAMNSDLGALLGGFDNYTPWYQMRGGQPDADILNAFAGTYGVDDAYKSFPSGHTCAAGMTYALCMLPDVLKIKNKPLRALCWIFPVAFTGVVAISRIVVGAHFFSDVLFGGTIAFLSMALAREIFVSKFSHFKCLSKNYVPTVEDETEMCA